MLSNYVDMSLYTAPIGNSGFPEVNTIFLFTLAFNYAALMGIFIAKVSRGRTIRSLPSKPCASSFPSRSWLWSSACWWVCLNG